MRAVILDGDNQGLRLPRIRTNATRTEQVLEIIRGAIVEGSLIPGSLHSVQSLAIELKVSRTPVREALLQLATDGMVRFERNRGVRILETSVHDLEEIFELRLCLEVPATAKAVDRMNSTLIGRLRREFTAMLREAEAGNEREMWRHDRAFHFEILKASGNLRMAQYVDGLRDLILMRGSTTANRSRSLVEIAGEHRPILKAVEQRKSAPAADEMRRHIQRTAELILFQESPRRSVLPK